QLRQHVGQALLGKGSLPHLVAAAVQADHQAVADQRVAAHTLYRGQVLDAFGLRRRGHQRGGRDNLAQPAQQRKETMRGAHDQNGEAIRKKRCSQPMVCTSSMTPLLRYSMRASATWVDETELAPVIERGSTTPAKRTYSLPRLMAICFSPATCRLPLGSTPITVVVMVPVKVLLARESPLPADSLAPDRSLSSLALAQLDRKSTRLNSSHVKISYAVFCLKKK